jgi:hypothetical protein
MGGRRLSAAADVEGVDKGSRILFTLGRRRPLPGCAGMAIYHQQRIASGDEQGITSSFIIHHSTFIIKK